MTLRRSTAAFLIFGGLAAGSSVGLAAFATHGLGESMGYPAERVRTFIDATEFQMSHGLALILIALACQAVMDGLSRRIMQVAGILFAAAILLFPGSVYNSTFGGSAALAPVGGFSSMIGWIVFAASAAVGYVKGEIALPVGRHPHPAE